MVIRLIPLAALLFATPALAQPAHDQPKPKAARVPPRPHLPTVMRPALERDAAPAARSDRRAAPPVPSRAVSELGKALAGTYLCKGSFANVEGGQRQTTARMKVTTDLAGYWIAFDIDESADAADYPLEIRIDRTYSESARTWQSVMLDNRGHLAIATAEHGDAPTVVWSGTSHRDGSEVRVRMHEDRDDRAGDLRLWSEVSGDGSTYRLQFDLTCTK